MSEYKRKYRELSDATKEKISKSLTGKKRDYTTRQKLSNSLKNYWKSVPSRDDEHIAMQEYLTGEKNNDVKSSNTYEQ